MKIPLHHTNRHIPLKYGEGGGKCSRDFVTALKITIKVDIAVNAINKLSMHVINIAPNSTVIHFFWIPINEINIFKEVIYYLKLTRSDYTNKQFYKIYTETYT